MKLVVILVAALLLSVQVQSSGSDYAPFVSARAYFVGWDLLTRVPLGIDDVIKMKRVYLEVNDPGLTENFVTWLRLSDMAKRTSTRPGDARLVIELTDEEGNVTILYSDGSHILSADSSRARPVDDAFRDRFDVAKK